MYIETIYIVSEKTTEEEREKITSDIRSILNETGKVKDHEAWGLRKLAWPIDKQNKGYYNYFSYIPEDWGNYKKQTQILNKYYNSNEKILKHIIVKIDE